jgi:hypothetical protein
MTGIVEVVVAARLVVVVARTVVVVVVARSVVVVARSVVVVARSVVVVARSVVVVAQGARGGGRAAALLHGHGITHLAVAAHHLGRQRVAVDGDPGVVVRRLGVGGERRAADRPEILPAAAGREVDRALSGRDRAIGAQRYRALVVVLVALEDDVDAVAVEERHQVVADGGVAAVRAARVDRVMEGDELPARPARGEIRFEEVVLRGGDARARVAVEHRHVRVAVVEGVVVLGGGRVVGGRVEEAPPGRAAVGADVVVAEAGPEDELLEERRIRPEEVRVEAARLAVVVDHVAGVHQKSER